MKIYLLWIYILTIYEKFIILLIMDIVIYVVDIKL